MRKREREREKEREREREKERERERERKESRVRVVAVLCCERKKSVRIRGTANEIRHSICGSTLINAYFIFSMGRDDLR